MSKLNISVKIDDNSGFCFGVVGAISRAEEVLNKHEELYCIGEIVHNDEEVKRLEKKGLISITHSDLKKLKNKKVLFRAHGEPPQSYITSEENNNTIYDASCPIILKFQKRIKKSYENDENIYMFGKTNHPETIGLNGQINNAAILFEKLEDLNLDEMPNNITLYSQTTKSLEEFHKIVEFLRSKGKTIKVNDTICRQVSNRQPNLRIFSQQYDKIVFVAGKKSSNGKVLFNVCKQINPNSYFVSSVDEIDNKWFGDGDMVGICGATSTPMWLMKDVQQEILSY